MATIRKLSNGKYRADIRKNYTFIQAKTFLSKKQAEQWATEMDVVLREDESRIRKGNAPSIMTSIRHLVLNLFQKEPSKPSLAKKRKMAAWDGDFRGKVLFADNF